MNLHSNPKRVTLLVELVKKLGANQNKIRTHPLGIMNV